LRKVAVVTSTRADFGIYRPVLKAIGNEPDLQAAILACGTHLVPDYGGTASEIEEAGFEIAQEIHTFAGAASPDDVCRSMAKSATGISQAFADERPDIVLVLGDRYEMFSAAAAALVHSLPLAHIHGGELSEGVNDDAFRHVITKMSHLHFVSTQDHGRRVRQLGEASDRVHVTGAPGLDTLSDDEIADQKELEEFLKLPFETSPIVATYHPVTLEPYQSVYQVGELLAVLEKTDRPVVITYPNADAEAERIISEIREFAASHSHAVAVPSLGLRRYRGLMRSACAMVGNSSSGIIEAASFELPVVNIGDRQRGRTRGQNVIDVTADRVSIAKGLGRAVSDTFRKSLTGMQNPYGDGKASARIAHILKTAELGPALLKKTFKDWLEPPNPSESLQGKSKRHG
jgi:UDP-hydrolysing UDP-N-acetyl-D-glucosamine 2-epimerase